MIIILLLCLCFATKNYKVDGLMPNLSKNEDLELEKHLKLINKPPIKTIQTELGSIVDCIDINKQHAFDNPLLKNHKIQLKPSYQDTTTKAKARDRSARFSNIGLWNSCPRGTVPVQRTTKEDLKRAKWLSNNIGTLNQASPGNHFAGVKISFNDAVYFGVNGTISTYNPTVANGQMSAVYIWVANGTNQVDSYNCSIQAGWQVYPDISGDSKTHFFASWSNNIQHTGCINGLCPGFVQTSQTIYLGSPVSNISTYDGPQFEMNLSLTQDNGTNNWWLRAQDTDVGYFPAELFSNNMLYANQGGWGGRTMISDWNGPSPPMGSGHLPDGNPRHSCYISRITFKDRFRQDVGPLRSNAATYADNPNCYNVTYYDYVDDNLRRALMLGGPGGDCVK